MKARDQIWPADCSELFWRSYEEIHVDASRADLRRRDPWRARNRYRTARGQPPSPPPAPRRWSDSRHRRRALDDPSRYRDLPPSCLDGAGGAHERRVAQITAARPHVSLSRRLTAVLVEPSMLARDLFEFAQARGVGGRISLRFREFALTLELAVTLEPPRIERPVLTGLQDRAVGLAGVPAVAKAAPGRQRKYILEDRFDPVFRVPQLQLA